MACYDSENARHVDRIRAISFREARDAGADFITRSWVAKRLNRSEQFVKMNWQRDPYHCNMVQDPQLGSRTLSDQSKEIIKRDVGKQKRSVRVLTKILENERGKVRSHMTVFRELRRMGMKPFHVIRKPLLSEDARENRLWFANFLKDWDEEDALHLAPSDEFYVYSLRRPNHQNDRVWALSPKDIDDDERFRGLPQAPACIGIFVVFTAKTILWVMKEDGAKWNGEYFRSILSDHVIPFLKNPQNVISVTDVTFLHDKAPCCKALATQALLRESGVDFFSSSEWPGSSPDLNPAEHIGAIIKDGVEDHLRRGGDHSQAALRQAIDAVLTGMRGNTDLFERLLCSYPARIKAVFEADGGPTDY